ncbi:methyltransferase domain-containing protein [Streptomyces catenulae]|uniref:Methyltransferase domain-containing protein n=1 Tax=Streptomyces catenulae TaxID=66875 RepID=A0ABV2Z3S0_9ACTN|nr:methyltransferase domain-containing protein [Streptomyces catenulae]
MGVRLLARTLRGVEEVCAQEITARGLGTVERLRHREVWFTAEEPDARLLDLRTADDVFLVATVIRGVGHTKADLARFTQPSRTAPWRRLLRLRGRCGGPDAATRIDVVASYVGKRNYNRYDIEDTVGEQAEAVLGLPHHSRRDGAVPDDGRPFPIRVTVEGTEAMVAVRLTERPLHRRVYKQESVPGTLHPPLAAAMALLADLSPGDRVLDPSCGTGTLLIESRLTVDGLRTLGTDHTPATLAAAVANASAARPTGGAHADWAVADAGRLPVADGQADRVLSNPPWGLQVAPGGTLATRPAAYYEEIRRVLRPGTGRAVLLLHEPETHLALARGAGLRVHDSRPVSLFGSHPAVVTLGR